MDFNPYINIKTKEPKSVVLSDNNFKELTKIQKHIKKSKEELVNIAIRRMLKDL